ncbi:unnamed protein product [Parascedosporium putredinis]|uniref:Uncharacterized protein n=1 Tax=Parascedosporium putredinis TaxID=1442378 RepID=A0A9P1M9Q7_9PEZI|nr:unnamed protein product [Parascedosporium putredinis]CAI7992491.1 unnamed protein product [Parascedosporium putredinis]
MKLLPAIVVSQLLAIAAGQAAVNEAEPAAVADAPQTVPTVGANDHPPPCIPKHHHTNTDRKKLHPTTAPAKPSATTIPTSEMPGYEEAHGSGYGYVSPVWASWNIVWRKCPEQSSFESPPVELDSDPEVVPAPVQPRRRRNPLPLHMRSENVAGEAAEN